MSTDEVNVFKMLTALLLFYTGIREEEINIKKNFKVKK